MDRCAEQGVNPKVYEDCKMIFYKYTDSQLWHSAPETNDINPFTSIIIY